MKTSILFLTIFVTHLNASEIDLESYAGKYEAICNDKDAQSAFIEYFPNSNSLALSISANRYLFFDIGAGWQKETDRHSGGCTFIKYRS